MQRLLLWAKPAGKMYRLKIAPGSRIKCWKSGELNEMTVRELIEQLMKFPADAPVILRQDPNSPDDNFVCVCEDRDDDIPGKLVRTVVLY